MTVKLTLILLPFAEAKMIDDQCHIICPVFDNECWLV